MTEQLLFYFFILSGICLTGFWMERLLKIWYNKRQQTQEFLLLDISNAIKSLYDYLTEDIKDEQNQ